MFAYISGTIQHKSNAFVIVDNAGIGYKINTSAATLARIGNAGENTKVFTHYHVREDDISLFGFATMEELNMFEMLITVSGVGPKVALAILSSISPSSFALSVITSDAKGLTKAQGVGLKLAQRIILELKDKIEKEAKGQVEAGVFAGAGEIDDDFSFSGKSTKYMEAVSALVVLGYNQFESNKAIAKIYNETLELEQLIMAALKDMSR